MPEFLSNLDLDLALKIFTTIVIVGVVYFFLNTVLRVARNKLVKKVKTKREKSNVKIFFQVLQYLIISLTIIFAILSYTGSLAGIGMTAGLLSAALGWALQRPITGMAAWLMLVIKRPFEIGDRIIIGTIKGDVSNITLTHVHIGEIGGTIASEETSGRVIMIPNAKLFEENIINYTQQNDLILDHVKFAITFDSDLKKTQRICMESAKKVLKEHIENPEIPYLRSKFQSSGVDVSVRYNAPAAIREEISTGVTEAIFAGINKCKDVRFAYPHTEVVLRQKATDN